MDERIEKAFETANYMATLSNQKRLMKEGFEQKLMFYINGSTFQIDPTLINYTKNLIDLDKTEAIFIDSNNVPVEVSDLKQFFENITSQYFSACQDYFTKYSEIRTLRKIKDIVEL